MTPNSEGNSTSVSNIEQTAAAWLLRREAIDWSPADQIQLDRWLAQNSSHRVAYIRLQSVWQNTPRLKSVAAGLPQGVPPPGLIERTPFFSMHRVAAEDSAAPGGLEGFEPLAPIVVRDANCSPDHTREFRGPGQTGCVLGAARIRWPLAAGLLLLAACGGWYFWPGGTTYTTQVGGRATVPTKDGSTITLNTATQLRVRLTDTERHVTLNHGEAYFEVARDPKRPFVVSAANKRVIAVGTKFSVRTEDNQVRVSVTEGTVRLEEEAQRGGRSPENLDHETAKLLPAGTVAVTSATEPAAVRVRREDVPAVEQQLSWLTGSIVLARTPLPEAIAEFNRYSTRQLVLESDPALQSTVVGGNFRTNNLDGFLRLLEQGFGVHATQDGERIILSRK